MYRSRGSCEDRSPFTTRRNGPCSALLLRRLRGKPAAVFSFFRACGDHELQFKGCASWVFGHRCIKSGAQMHGAPATSSSVWRARSLGGAWCPGALGGQMCAATSSQGCHRILGRAGACRRYSSTIRSIQRLLAGSRQPNGRVAFAAKTSFTHLAAWASCRIDLVMVHTGPLLPGSARVGCAEPAPPGRSHGTQLLHGGT